MQLRIQEATKQLRTTVYGCNDSARTNAIRLIKANI